MKIKHLLENNNRPKYIYRGIKTGDPNNVTIQPKVITITPDDKQHRKPKNTSIFVHNLVNVLTHERFGVYIRNLPFFYKNPKFTRYYGYIYKAKVDEDMTFYYADYFFDFTVKLEAVERAYTRFNPSALFEHIDEASEIAFNVDFKKFLYDAIETMSREIELPTLKFDSIEDLENIYKNIGENVFENMISNGYEYEKNKEAIVDMVVKGVKSYFKKFYDYAYNVKESKSYDDIPETVEIMVSAPEIEMKKVKD